MSEYCFTYKWKELEKGKHQEDSSISILIKNTITLFVK